MCYRFGTQRCPVTGTTMHGHNFYTNRFTRTHSVFCVQYASPVNRIGFFLISFVNVFIIILRPYACLVVRLVVYFTHTHTHQTSLRPNDFIDMKLCLSNDGAIIVNLAKCIAVKLYVLYYLLISRQESHPEGDVARTIQLTHSRGITLRIKGLRLIRLFCVKSSLETGIGPKLNPTSSIDPMFWKLLLKNKKK